MTARRLSAANLSPRFYLGAMFLVAIFLIVAFVYVHQDNDSVVAVYEPNMFPREKITKPNKFPAEKTTTGAELFLGSKVLCALFRNLHSLPFLPLFPVKGKLQNKACTEPLTS